METTIVKIEGNKIEVVENNEIKGYELEEWVKPEFVNLGAAEITIKEGKVAFCTMKKVEKTAEKPVQTTPSSGSSDIINIKGKDFMTYEGLLKKAHEKGKFDMVITESWVSEDMKKAWCKVRLTAEGQVFDGFGSSTPDNTGSMTQSHPVEMSHTRAKGRALRDYLNIGTVMAEELKDQK